MQRAMQGMLAAGLGLALGLAACGREEAAREAAPAHEHAAPAARNEAPGAAQTLTLVEARDQVCMVTNRLFGSAQIPVDVQGVTYYGCCEGCKARLAEDAGVRRSVDPVSGRPVDKAKAVIGALPDGRVVYFESAENLRAWTPAHGGIPRPE